MNESSGTLHDTEPITLRRYILYSELTAKGVRGGSGILPSILVLLLQGSYVLTIPSKLKKDSKKKDWKEKEENWRKKFRAISRLPKIEEI
jgi:hypothetical protein